VSFREETELFNIWTAYLNLEVMFGDENSLKAVFERAANAANPLKIHKQMAKILAHHKRNEELDELFETMIKKFRYEDLEVWFSYAAYLYENKRPQEARDLLQRALDSLNRKHR
jgi:rRNA biogenesis protein RRP5